MRQGKYDLPSRIPRLVVGLLDDGPKIGFQLLNELVVQVGAILEGSRQFVGV